jgi:hypothetical protein
MRRVRAFLRIRVDKFRTQIFGAHGFGRRLFEVVRSDGLRAENELDRGIYQVEELLER